MRRTPGGRAPQQVQLDFPYFRLIEMFHLEDFDVLRDGIFKLFPGLQDDFHYRLSSDAFIDQANSIQGGGWGHLGYIVRDIKTRWLGMEAYRELPELPPEVDFIKVEYHKILPSVF